MTVHGKPHIYEDYQNVYDNELVDIVYIGIPHALHKKACLAATNAGKHVLCEKPTCINERDAQEVIAAAREKRVFWMKAVRTRFFPLVKVLKKALYEEKVIGEARHTGVGEQSSNPDFASSLKVMDGIEYADSVILKYPETQRMAILAASLEYQTAEELSRIEGSNGEIVLSGPATSKPTRFKIDTSGTERIVGYDDPGMGFYYEADTEALNIQAGRLENTTMPVTRTLRILQMMSGIRRKGGLIYPQDLEEV